MDIIEWAGILYLGFLCDVIWGDPPYRGHPVRRIGHAVSALEHVLFKRGFNGRLGGLFLAILSITGSILAYLVIRFLFQAVWHPLSFLFDIFICYSFLAYTDLLRHIRPVITAVESQKWPLARDNLSKIVGRDVLYLDENGVYRAAIETLAENFVDGILSPLFWFVTGGTLGYVLGMSPTPCAISLMIVFKVISTLDSMVGYKNQRYAQFGWAGARLDDLMNFIPARLSLVILFFGAWVAGLHPMMGLKVARKDRLKHDSPNAAHAESFFAGSLGLRLGGPTRYAEGMKQKPWLGMGNDNPGPQDMYKAVRLVKVSTYVTLLLVTFLFIMLSSLFSPK